MARGIPNSLMPNYTDSVANVYARAVKFIIMQEKNVQVLSSVNCDIFPGANCSSYLKYPSWVPDFISQRPIINHSFISPETGLSTFSISLNASKTESVQFDEKQSTDDSLQIALAGLRVGVVGWRPESKDLRSWYSEAAANRSYLSISGQPNSDSFIRDFISVVSGAAGLENPGFEQSKVYLKCSASQSPLLPSPQGDEGLARSQRKPEATKSTLVSRLDDYHTLGTKFFVTEDGHVAVGPEHIKKGEIVSIVYGSKVPFILRQCSGHMHMIGECYVPFWMDGRAIELRDAGQLKEELFRLR
jgi:hypothetical protein